MKKLPILFLTIALGMSSVTAFASQSNEQPKKVVISQEDTKKVIQDLKYHNVPADKQKNIISKLKNGKVLDCFNPEKVKLMPLDALDASQDNPTKKYVFDDGSFIETSITEISKIEVKPENRDRLINSIGSIEKVDSMIEKSVKQQKLNSIKNTTTDLIKPNGVISGSGYSYYYDTLIKRSLTGVSAEFYATFTLVNGDVDVINTVNRPSCTISLGSYSDLQLNVIYPSENSWTGQPALADLSFNATASVSTAWVGYSSGSTCHLSLSVGHNTYSVGHN